jgi:hypothetical protein
MMRLNPENDEPLGFYFILKIIFIFFFSSSYQIARVRVITV